MFTLSLIPLFLVILAALITHEALSLAFHYALRRRLQQRYVQQVDALLDALEAEAAEAEAEAAMMTRQHEGGYPIPITVIRGGKTDLQA